MLHWLLQLHSTFHAPIEERKALRNVVKPEPLWKVPTTFTSFIGREQDVAAIEAMLLRPEVRLLTLVGIRRYRQDPSGLTNSNTDAVIFC